MQLRAEDIMKEAITLKPNNTLADARDIMLKYDISRIVVANDNKPVGIVTEKSISRFLYRDGRPLDELRLDQVMRRDLITVNRDTSIKECAKRMLDNRISSLLVVDEKCYIFTKTDLIKVYAEHFRNKSKVRRYMVSNVYTVLPTHSLHRVLSILVRNKVSRVVVVRNNKPVGIITSRDLLPTSTLIEVDAKLEEDLTYGNASELAHVLLARDVMKKPLTINADADLADAASIMINNNISGLPVVDKDNDLRGIITKTDIIRALIELS